MGADAEPALIAVPWLDMERLAAERAMLAAQNETMRRENAALSRVWPDTAAGESGEGL